MRPRGRVAVLAGCLIVTATLVASRSPAAAVDRPVGGRRLCVRASAGNPNHRRLSLSARDAGIAPPFVDPSGGATLVLWNSAAAGQCFAEIALDPTKWTPLRGDGAQHGYEYVAAVPGTQGIRKIRIRPGKITVRAQGAGFPCTLSDATQQVPIAAELRLGGDRYCAAFGGTVDRNTLGRFYAHDAPAPAACLDDDVTVANLNILHGFGCQDAAHCRLEERVALMFQWIAAAGCPDVVTLQEVPNISATFTALPFIEAHRSTTCPFAYGFTYFPVNNVDAEVLLSRYPLVSAESQKLHLNFRSVLYARVDHPVGPLDVFTTHLASSGDGGNLPCASCPAECVLAGAVTNRDCQAVQVAERVVARHDVDPPAVIAGDFNDPPGTFAYNQFVDRGWTDVHLAAGNPECVPATGVGCTSGREGVILTELESPASNVDERIDYIFLVPPGAGSSCTPTIDSFADDDGDGTSTMIFADDPNPFAPTCGPAPDPICWPSDHEGVQLDLNCR